MRRANVVPAASGGGLNKAQDRVERSRVYEFGVVKRDRRRVDSFIFFASFRCLYFFFLDGITFNTLLCY